MVFDSYSYYLQQQLHAARTSFSLYRAAVVIPVPIPIAIPIAVDLPQASNQYATSGHSCEPSRRRTDSCTACKACTCQALRIPHHYFLRHRFLTRPCSGQRGRLSASTLSTRKLGSATDIRTFRRFRRSIRIDQAIRTVFLPIPRHLRLGLFIRVPLPAPSGLTDPSTISAKPCK